VDPQVREPYTICFEHCQCIATAALAAPTALAAALPAALATACATTIQCVHPGSARAHMHLNSRLTAGPKWYENNTVLTVSSVGGLLVLVYFFGFIMLLLYYKVIKPKADERRAVRARR
jgi:hypothetical protein